MSSEFLASDSDGNEGDTDKNGSFAFGEDRDCEEHIEFDRDVRKVWDFITERGSTLLDSDRHGIGEGSTTLPFNLLSSVLGPDLEAELNP